MPIEIPDGQRGPGTYVVKRTELGERFIGAIIKTEQRDVLKDGAAQINERTGKPRQELVVHAIALPGTTALVGRGDDHRKPEVGEEVRIIFRGGGFGAFIEARKTHRNNGALQVGDLIATSSDYAQAYDANGAPTGDRLTTQEAINALKLRGKTVGLYGAVQLAEPRDHQWTQAAEKAYMKATEIVLGDPGTPTSPSTAPSPEPFPNTPVTGPSAPPQVAEPSTPAPAPPTAGDLFGGLVD